MGKHYDYECDKCKSLADKLDKHKGCCVTIFFECGDICKCIKGIICDVGCDFVDLIIKKDCCCEKVLTISIPKISTVKFPDNCCDPCKKEKKCYDDYDECDDC